MTVVGICRCRNEADIIAATVCQMLTQVDHVIVEDNGSTDGTLDILTHLGVEVRHDPNFAHRQGDRMNALAAHAARQGATIVLPFDADEWFYSPFGRIATVLGEHPAAAIFTAALYDHVATATDPPGDPASAMGWRRREATPLHKVACRPAMPVRIHEGNHGASYPEPYVLHGLLVARHYPLRSAEHMIRKARHGGAALAATDLPEHVGAHWRDWNRLSDEQLRETFREHYFAAEPHVDPSLIFDPAVACPSRS